MGNELKKDVCPEKYCAKSSIIKDSIPTIIAILVVAFFSGSFFNNSGLNIAVTIVIEAAFVILLYSIFYIFMSGMKKRWAETYISVCENGVCGICPLNGYKNKTFELYFNEITKITVKGERLFLYSQKGVVALTLKDANGTAKIIKSKNANL